MAIQSSNVVPLFGSKKVVPKNGSTGGSILDDEAASEAFLNNMKKNMENAERMRVERLKANKSVLRSYNIKD